MNRSTTLAGLLRSTTITMAEFRKRPGEYILAVERARQTFVITKNGREVARLVPMDDGTIIESDGTVIGDMPLTYRSTELGG